MIKKLLIANRGEIACRIIKTAQALGIRCVAMYSEADADALHVRLADEAYALGGVTANESYLNLEKIAVLLKHVQPDAVHPGYGFLSENPALARLCAELDIIFVGPSADVIETMGSKSRAKEVARKAGVPLIPGYDGAQQDLKTLRSEAERIGFPIILKPIMGGGGKGMRIVPTLAAFDEAFFAAQREATSAFADARIFIEKYIGSARHIEVQLMADAHGNIVHLYERDCSIQRRHQKIIEEAPAFAVPAEICSEMRKAAISLAKAVNYVNAGTVEFLYEKDTNRFYFMEMNTRLQVEHPVTEKITGIDLVEWQLRVASGAVLPLHQEDILCRGHSIETRLYAEDPERNFLPSIGTLIRFDGFYERLDTGVEKGSAISVHYDPMIAKLIAGGNSRQEAVAALQRSLAHAVIMGVTTNQAFLVTLMEHPLFRAGEYDTQFLDALTDDTYRQNLPDDICVFAAFLLAIPGDANGASPWAADGFRVNLAQEASVAFLCNGRPHKARLQCQQGAWTLWLDEAAAPLKIAALSRNLESASAEIDGRHITVAIAWHKGELWLSGQGSSWHFSLSQGYGESGKEEGGDGKCVAPLPGKITKLWTAPGQKVEIGSPLITLEAMKMEHTLKASIKGEVNQLLCQEGDVVMEGQELLFIAALEAEKLDEPLS